MALRQVPSEQWPALVDQFSRLHQGKAVQISLTGPVIGTRRYSTDQPLLGLVDERHGEADESISVVWGGKSAGTFSHSMRRPNRVSIAEWNDACSARLEIESAEGDRLVIQAGPAAELLAPGMITDGVLLEKQQ
jgi:hypothetical protein